MHKSTVAVSLDENGKPVDLHEPGAVEALLAFHRSAFGGMKMERTDDDDPDDDDPDDDDPDDDDPDDDDPDDDDDDDDEELTPAQQRAVERAANRIADRRINQALSRDRRRRRSNGGGGGRQNDRGRGRDRDDDPDDRRGGNDRASDADAREARLVYRESVADHVVVSRDERPVAQALSRSFIAESLSNGADVVDAGEQAAEEVGKALKRLRRSIRSQTIRRLKSEGVLSQDYAEKSQPKRGRSTPGKRGPNEETGKAIADSLYADRIKQDDK